jgi:hypothetical protein
MVMRSMSVESIDWNAEYTKPRGDTMNSMGDVVMESADEDDAVPYKKGWFLQFKNDEEETDYQYYLGLLSLSCIILPCVVFIVC